MKKVIITIIICFCIFSLFSSSKGNSNSSSSYEQGYEDGVRAALTALRDVSNDWDRYANVEDVEDNIYRNFKNNPYVDSDEIRDAIIEQTYTEDRLLEKLINETTLED